MTGPLCRRACTAATLGFLLAPGFAAAQSSVTLYGQIDEWVGSQKFPGGQRAWELGGGGMSTSYWGIKGGEDLGGGTRAVFSLEAFFRPQNGGMGRFSGDTFFARNAWLGAESPYGTLVAGRITTPLFISTILFNPFADSYQFSPMIYHTYLGTSTFQPFATDQGAIGDSGWSNAVEYASPSFNGLTGTAMYAFGNAAGAGGQHKDSAQLLYLGKAFSATAVYQYVNYSNVAGDFADPASSGVVPGLHSQSIAQAGLAYDFRIVKLYAQYMFTDNALDAGHYHVNTAQAGVSLPVGLDFVLASWAWSKDSGGMEQSRNTWAIGYDHPLSKRTDVYAAYMHDKLSGEPVGDTFGVGMRAKF
nr:porin [Paraburkholderia oxyphila]